MSGGVFDIPPLLTLNDMKGAHMSTTLHSFAELGKVFRIQPKARKAPQFRCRKCGTMMDNVPGTNVYLCNGKNSEGEPCTNRLFSRSYAG